MARWPGANVAKSRPHTDNGWWIRAIVAMHDSQFSSGCYNSSSLWLFVEQRFI
ncbi:hypothetical protein KIN20_019525 [Parelaphostrongylus tenuis]|uniref:Uncharacterized protein n=1 Tax=Parelaphostrongylus tenuis TaxID=148309 RepID=A0AAD5N2B3_PARTN|nr:hypothetical protein KIN20_019525 [Parelaphostrongylus tenuis]